MSESKSLIDLAYEKFIISKANQTVSTRDIYRAGHAEGIRKAMVLAEPLQAMCERYEIASSRSGSDLMKGMTIGVHNVLSSALQKFNRIKGEK